MVFTDAGKELTALQAWTPSGNRPIAIAIGSGSGTALAVDTSLAYPVDGQAFTATTYPSSQKIKQQGDWNSVEMSGIQLQQFGMITSGAGVTGSVWSKTSLPPLTFDGTNELRVEENWEVY